MKSKPGSRTTINKSINLTPALIAQVESRAGRATFSSRIIADLTCHYSLLEVLSREISGRFINAEIKIIGSAIAGIDLAGQVPTIQQSLSWNLNKPTILMQAKKQDIGIADLICKIESLTIAEAVWLWDTAQNQALAP